VLGLDKETGVENAIAHPRFSFAQGVIEDPAMVEHVVAGVEAIVHLAWSFSDDPRVLVEQDLRGHALLLEAAARHTVSHFVYTSTAVVYGKPSRVPVGEDHPLNVLAARKPAYGVAKEFAEKLVLLAGQAGMSSTIVRFWWAFGDEIGGRHLRRCCDVRRRQAPGGAGGLRGSFLSQDDFNLAVETILQRPTAAGRVFNLASAYVTWEDVAEWSWRSQGTRRDRGGAARSLGRRRLSRRPLGAGRPPDPGAAGLQAASRGIRSSGRLATGDRQDVGAPPGPGIVTRSVLRFGGRVLSRSVEASDMRFPDRHDGGTS